jgi:hypothetical protein
MRISFSQRDVYNQCSEKWRLHYKEKIRTDRIGSALFFGRACDEAFNRLLLAKKTHLTEEDKEFMEKSAMDHFYDNMKEMVMNDETVFLKNSIKPLYFNSDYTPELFEDKDLSEIYDRACELDLVLRDEDELEQFVKECRAIIKNDNKLEEEELFLFNLIHWLSLKKKGELMVEAYAKEVLPKIHEVHSIQEMVDLKDEGDHLVGAIDFTCTFTEDPDLLFIVDNKTSSRPYKKDSVYYSEQLATYSEYKGIKHCAYIVVEKSIRKRHPRVRTNIIKDVIPEETLDKTFDNFTDVIYNIKEKKFKKLQEPKKCFFFGRKCDFYNYCWNNKDMSDLINLKEKRQYADKNKS